MRINLNEILARDDYKRMTENLKSITEEIARAIHKKMDELEIENNTDFDNGEIGVDDVAIRKGQTYATAIYDMKDHHLLALLEGRDGENFKEWLKKHPKIRKVTRDRANAYASAINKILRECVQIADRFHILQNLIEYLETLIDKAWKYDELNK